MTDQTPAIAARRSRTLLFLLMALGLLGVATMLLVPLEDALPPGIEVPRVLLLIQPAILVIGASLIGWWAAPKVGLDAPVLGAVAVRGNWLTPLRQALPLALLGGVLSAAILVVYGLGTAGFFDDQDSSLSLPMLTRVGYGGVSEEILLRWGLMSVLALAALKLGLARPASIWAGNIAAALIFAFGHLPALYALVDPPGWLVAAVLAGNGSVGIIFGWLFARRGLEAAMIAHALAHLIGVPVATLLLSS